MNIKELASTVTQTTSMFHSVSSFATRVFGLLLVFHRDVLKMEEWSKKTGGYFTLAQDDGTPLLTFRIGAVIPEKTDKYFHLSLEKARRLGQNKSHGSSFKSRDGRKRWGGAVRGRGLNNILSFSGLTEVGDMILTYFVAEKLGFRSPEEIKALAEGENFYGEYSRFKDFISGFETTLDFLQ